MLIFITIIIESYIYKTYFYTYILIDMNTSCAYIYIYIYIYTQTSDDSNRTSRIEFIQVELTSFV